jgi:hypothetical protein
MTPRTEPMPDPVPEWLKKKALALGEANHAKFWWEIVAELLWKMGEPEPVDPDVEAVKRIIEAWYMPNDINWSYLPYDDMLQRALAAYKAEKDRT